MMVSLLTSHSQMLAGVLMTALYKLVLLQRHCLNWADDPFLAVIYCANGRRGWVHTTLHDPLLFVGWLEWC